MRLHTGEKPFQCRFCDHRARVKAMIQSHEKSCTANPEFVATDAKPAFPRVAPKREGGGVGGGRAGRPKRTKVGGGAVYNPRMCFPWGLAMNLQPLVLCGVQPAVAVEDHDSVGDIVVDDVELPGDMPESNVTV